MYYYNINKFKLYEAPDFIATSLSKQGWHCHIQIYLNMMASLLYWLPEGINVTRKSTVKIKRLLSMECLCIRERPYKRPILIPLFILIRECDEYHSLFCLENVMNIQHLMFMLTFEGFFTNIRRMAIHLHINWKCHLHRLLWNFVCPT